MRNMSRKRVRAALAGILPLLLVSTAWAQLPVFDPAIADSRAFIEQRIAEGFPGIAVSVAWDGTSVWSEGFGYANVETHEPVTRETKFRVGSISKVLTASAVGLLVERRKLELDQPIQTYVIYFPVKDHPITTRLLAGHSAGIRHYQGVEGLSSKQYDSVKDSLAIFQNDPLLFEPGTQVSYSSYGWNLVSAAVEGASGEAFLEFLDANVFEPLTMSNTMAEFFGKEIPNKTTFYSGMGDRRRISLPVNLSNKWASGGFISTADDLVAFGSAHLKAGFLKPETLELLFTPQVLKNGETSLYGIGWRVDPASPELKHRGIHHSGSSQGGKGTLMLYPEFGLAVAILINCDAYTTNVEDARTIADAFAAVAPVPESARTK